MSQIRSLYRALFRRCANFYFAKLRFAVVWLGQIQNLDTGHVYVLGLESGSERLSCMRMCHEYRFLTAHTWMGLSTHIHESRYTSKSSLKMTTAHQNMWSSHSKHANESQHTYKFGTSLIRICHSTRVNESCHSTHVNESCHSTHVNESCHSTHANESCRTAHIWMSHVAQAARAGRSSGADDDDGDYLMRQHLNDSLYDEVAVCCSVLQRVATCCSVLQRDAACFRWPLARTLSFFL